MLGERVHRTGQSVCSGRLAVLLLGCRAGGGICMIVGLESKQRARRVERRPGVCVKTALAQVLVVFQPITARDDWC